MDGNILVATDFTRYAHDAVERIGRLPLEPGARITLLHVVPSGLDEAVSARLEASSRTMIAGAAATLEAELIRAGRHGIAHESIVARGRPAEVIAERAHQLHARLVVIGRGERHGIGERLLGSTAERVVRSCDANVLLITRARSAPYRRPLLAIDFSDVSRRALVATLRLCGHAAEIAVLHAFDAPYLVMLREGGMPEKEVADYVSASERKARAQLDGWLHEARVVAPHIEPLLMAGDARDAILATAHARNNDLIVIGSQRHSRIGGLLTGSVSEWIARVAPRDVLVVR
jgi:nucleotide-binding universal stress UspA family protein